MPVFHPGEQKSQMLFCLLVLPFSISSRSPHETPGCIHSDDDKSLNQCSRLLLVCSTVNQNGKTCGGFFFSWWQSTAIDVYSSLAFKEEKNYRQRCKVSFTWTLCSYFLYTPLGIAEQRCFKNRQSCAFFAFHKWWSWRLHGIFWLSMQGILSRALICYLKSWGW